MSDSTISQPKDSKPTKDNPFVSSIAVPKTRTTFTDFAALFGVILAWGALLVALILEGGELRALIHLPAAILVFGGTLGAGIMSSRSSQLAAIPSLLKKVFTEQTQEVSDVVLLLVRFADRARRTGLLSMEQEVTNLEDPFLRQGLLLVIDGTDPETIREILTTDIQFEAQRHKAEEGVFTTLGGFAPTLGIIGTVMGLIHMLTNLNDPAKMGPLIAGAFLATLYGVASANLIFLPIANKLRTVFAEERLIREVTLEGVLAIQSGNTPRVVEEKLKAFLNPRLRDTIAVPRSGRFQ
jgi:chemotaxis protein MotA